MTIFCKTKTDAVRCVSELLDNSEHDSQLTMTIVPGKSAGYYAYIATEELSADIGKTWTGYVYSPVRHDT